MNILRRPLSVNSMKNKMDFDKQALFKWYKIIDQTKSYINFDEVHITILNSFSTDFIIS